MPPEFPFHHRGKRRPCVSGILRGGKARYRAASKLETPLDGSFFNGFQEYAHILPPRAESLLKNRAHCPRAVLRCPDHKHSRCILIEPVTKEENGLLPKQRLKAGGSCDSRDRNGMFREAVGIKTTGNKTHFPARKEIFIKCEGSTLTVGVETQLLRMLLHEEENIIRHESIEHLHHEQLIDIRASHGEGCRFRLDLQRHVHVSLRKVRHLLMFPIEINEHMRGTPPCDALEALAQIGKLQTTREEGDDMPQKIQRILPEHRTNDK